MAIKTLDTVERNTAPALALTAERPDGTVINLTGCTVNLVMTKSKTVTNTGHQSCTITDAANGLVSYTRQAADTPTSGSYLCDLVVTYASGGEEVLYDILKLKTRKRVDSTT